MHLFNLYSVSIFYRMLNCPSIVQYVIYPFCFIGMDYSNRPMYPQHPMMGGGGVPLRQPQPYPPPPPQA